LKFEFLFKFQGIFHCPLSAFDSAQRDSRPGFDKRHVPGKNENCVGRCIVLQFRKAFVQAGLDPRLIWPEIFMNKKPSKRGKRLIKSILI
jgi:hypothetical protein